MPNNTGDITTGMVMGWNWSGGGGETDFLSYGQGAGDIGGFYFYATNTTTAPVLMAALTGTGNSLNLSTTTVTPTAGDNTTKIATTAFVSAAITAAASSALTGAIVMFAGYGSTSANTPPAGYLWCDGTAYSQTGTYSNLFAVIGTLYNTSSSIASTDFCVPYFHTGDGGSGVMPIAGSYTSTSQGTLGVVQSTGSTITLTSPTIYGGNSTIYTTQIPQHQHKMGNSGDNYVGNVNVQTYTMLSGGTTIATGASSIGTIVADTGNMVSGASSGAGGSDIYTSNNSQGQFYPQF
jgi:hypothetical protein